MKLYSLLDYLISFGFMWVLYKLAVNEVWVLMKLYSLLDQLNENMVCLA